ncbi:cytochrome b5 isoform A-like isoform X1 [Hibiscus syriacus]|uniref:Protein TILLER ANGLE CONTROL 1 n=1 Tax=Hibiscus syriacus TaxID=106335 RepID=A0A6A2ZNQ3_HIBSY|nr:protein TILLER ANGLE CONTROL 1-like isoform X2 [Hibiscus syriacus]KAE8693661.1 cytochrome b5 isoform A-like isoform X1 [Hibiscus syriacus]
MKIFNWVQKRFHHNVLKDGLARNVKKTDSIAIDSNTKALLQQVALSDLLDGWREGILAIGTFGFDPLKQNDYDNDGGEEEAEEEERYTENVNNEDEDEYVENDSDEEVNPLMLSTLKHSFEDVDHAMYGETKVMRMVDVVGGCTDHEIELEATEGHSGKLGRTTLADLFSEDSDIKKKHCLLQLNSASCKKPSLRTKNGLSFAKKLIPQVAEDSHPIKMLRQIMRRMWKRKIHPELEGKGNKLVGQGKATPLDALAEKTRPATQSVPDAAAIA